MGWRPDPEHTPAWSAAGGAVMVVAGGATVILAIQPASSHIPSLVVWDCTASSQRTVDCSGTPPRHATETSGSRSWRGLTRSTSSSRPSKRRAPPARATTPSPPRRAETGRVAIPGHPCAQRAAVRPHDAPHGPVVGPPVARRLRCPIAGSYIGGGHRAAGGVVLQAATVTTRPSSVDRGGNSA